MIALRASNPADLDFITELERRPAHRDFIGQWTDAEHLSAMAGKDRRSHSIIERDGVPEGYLIAFDNRDEVGGIYLKRLLVDGKGRGTGTQALRLFIAQKFADPRTKLVWLLVRDANARAQAVYRKLGFERLELEGEEARRFDSLSDTPNESFRMILRKA
jgi:RimJ/RimL family protein N-acetyltransferase